MAAIAGDAMQYGLAARASGRLSDRSRGSATRCPFALDTIAPALNGFSYELKCQSPAELQFKRSSRPGGLLGLLAHENKERIVIAFQSKGSDQTTMIIHGRASRRVRKAFAALTFS